MRRRRAAGTDFPGHTDVRAPRSLRRAAVPPPPCACRAHETANRCPIHARPARCRCLAPASRGRRRPLLHVQGGGASRGSSASGREGRGKWDPRGANVVMRERTEPRRHHFTSIRHKAVALGTASSTAISVGVDVVRVSSKPAVSNSARYSSAVRSRPPVITNMLRSMNL